MSPESDQNQAQIQDVGMETFPVNNGILPMEQPRQQQPYPPQPGQSPIIVLDRDSINDVHSNLNNITTRIDTFIAWHNTHCTNTTLQRIADRQAQDGAIRAIAQSIENIKDSLRKNLSEQDEKINKIDKHATELDAKVDAADGKAVAVNTRINDYIATAKKLFKTIVKIPSAIGVAIGFLGAAAVWGKKLLNFILDLL